MKQKVTIAETGTCEQNTELIGILTAVSIIAKRLAGRLAALERQTTTETAKGGKTHVKNIRT